MPESMIHKEAKEKFINWIYKENINDDYINLKFDIGGIIKNISFRKNRVFIEYPVVINNEMNSLYYLWDEQYEYDDFIIDEKKICSPSPTYEWCIKKKLIPSVIFDLAVSHKGQIVYGIEIVYTNPISNKKKDKLKKILNDNYYGNFEVYEIDAKYILEQNKIPEIIKAERVISSNYDIKKNIISKKFINIWNFINIENLINEIKKYKITNLTKINFKFMNYSEKINRNKIQKYLFLYNNFNFNTSIINSKLDEIINFYRDEYSVLNDYIIQVSINFCNKTYDGMTISIYDSNYKFLKYMKLCMSLNTDKKLSMCRKLKKELHNLILKNIINVFEKENLNNSSA
jgi:hypothetical protein